MFTFFGQFFDHGLDLVPKRGGTVIIPLKADDPLFVADGSPTELHGDDARRRCQPGPDGILGTADDIQESINQTTPWVDQNQTYTSHPSHQVFLRSTRIDAHLRGTAGVPRRQSARRRPLRAARHRHPRRRHLQHRQLGAR